MSLIKEFVYVYSISNTMYGRIYFTYSNINKVAVPDSTAPKQ